MPKDISRGDPIATVYENGEIVDAPKPRKRRRPSRKDGPVYVMIELEAAQRVADSLTRTEEKILNIVLAHYTAEDSYARLSATDLAGLAGLKRQNAHAAIKRLIDRGFLYRISPTAYSVNPHYGFRGSRDEWAGALMTAKEPQW